MRNLGTENKADAIKALKKLAGVAQSKRFEILETTKLRQDVATLGEIFDLYKTYGITALEKTRRYNINSLGVIIRKVHGEKIDVRAQPATILTDRLLRDYQVAIVKRAGDDFNKIDSAHISANSTIRQARSIFGKKVRDAYKGLKLPNLQPFMAVTPLPEPRRRYKAPPPALITKTLDALPALKAADPDAYRIFLLAFGTGLRANEIREARHSWITGEPGNYTLRVETNSRFRPKDHEDRMLPMEDKVRDELVAMRIAKLDPAAPDRILEGGRQRPFRRFSAWMKTLGWDRKKQAHELRKYFGSSVTKQLGLYAAQKLLGHSDPNVTSEYYADLLEVPRIKMFP